MTFVWLPVSSGWRYDDTVLMNRYIQGDSLYIPERFGVEGELYVCNWSYEDLMLYGEGFKLTAPPWPAGMT